MLPKTWAKLKMHRYMVSKWLLAAVILTGVNGLCWASVAAVIAKPESSSDEGEKLYQQRCAACHDGPVARAPHKIMFPMQGPEYILSALNDGIMQAQASGLSEQQKIALAEHLGGRTLAVKDASNIFYCAENKEREKHTDNPTGTIANWGMGLKNSRAISAETANLTTADVSKLSLKWAFAYPGATRARSQPIASRGDLFVGSQDGTIFALDLASGCAHWTFKADTEVRHALSLSKANSDHPERLFFGDFNGAVYAIDRANGSLVWKTTVNDHPDTTITGSPKLHGDRLYVPLSSREWASAANPAYACCTFRGGVIALNIADGTEVWAAYSVKKPEPTGAKNTLGVELMAPSGAPVWNSPTIDVKRNRLYVGTGENYSSPASKTSDAVLAIDLDDGQILWSYQALSNDAWNMACFVGGLRGNCPVENGPDLDIGASVILHRLSSGRDILLAGQKSGYIFALDPEHDGKLLWKTKIGIGGFAGGVHWGMTAMADTLYAAIADTDFGFEPIWKGTPGLYAIDAASGDVNWYSAAEDRCPKDTRPACDQGLSAAITSIPGVVFAGAFDGFIRAYRQTDGKVIWEYPTNQTFTTVSGDTAHGGSIESDGPIVVDGTVLVNSGYSFGSRMPGNVLLAFSIAGELSDNSILGK